MADTPFGHGAGPIRIGNCSGFYGDRLSAMHEMLTAKPWSDSPLDVLTGDYLAELTMLILWRSRAKDPAKGYATTFLRQLEECLGIAVERGVKIVVNAGGLNPAGCADAVRTLADRLGISAQVAHVEGDDLMSRLDDFPALTETGTPITANAYLGAWPIVAALNGGADVVVTGRCTDASLVVGPAAWHHRWKVDDYDALAGAVVAGHVLECGAQATGGNYSFFTEIADMTHPGFPLAEVAADGSSVITKHPGTGGEVSIGTVTAQLLYEIGAPHYPGPDVTAHFGTIHLEQEGADRVRISGVSGQPPPDTVKVCLNHLGGFRNSMTFVLTGLDVDAKAELVQTQLTPVLAGVGEVDVRLSRTSKEDAATNDEAVSSLRITVKDSSPEKIGRPFSSAVVEMALASYPGCTLTSPPGEATPYGVYRAAYIPREAVGMAPIADRFETHAHTFPWGGPFDGPTQRVPFGRVFGARSGDKGGDANLGIWARDGNSYRWLFDNMSVDRLKKLLPECADLEVERYELGNIWAVNFVIHGLLGEGVSSSTRPDPQAKGLGEWLRSRYVDLPVSLL